MPKVVSSDAWAIGEGNTASFHRTEVAGDRLRKEKLTGRVPQMKEKTIAFAAVLLMIVLLPTGQSVASAESSSEYAVRIDRVAEIGGWGLVTVNDTLTIRNNSTAVLTEIAIGLPRNLTDGLRYLAATDDQSTVLIIERDLDSASETYWFRVNFARVLAFNESYGIKVTSVFMNVLVPEGEGFQYRFYANPILRVRAASANMTIIAGADRKFSVPQGLDLKETSEEGHVILRGYFAPIEPYTTKPMVLNMTSTSQFIVRVPHVVREITFDPSGKVGVSDKYDFENLVGSVSTIPLRLSQNSSNVMAYDLIGPLWDSPRRGPEISVGPRYPGGVGSNRTFSFTVKYELDPRTYVTQLRWWGGYSCRLILLPDVRFWVVDKLTTSVVVPNGVNVRNLLPSPSSISSSLFNRRFEYELTNVTPYTDLALSLDYSYAPFWSGSLVLAWVGIIELVAVASALVLRTRKPPALKIPVPTEKLRQFVQLYDGRTALRLELDRMAGDLSRGALNKHEYRRRRKTIELRMSELDRALQPLRQDLKQFHPRYSEMILKMEKAEADIDANRLSDEHFRAQYRSGKISKEAYETALRDLDRRIDKAREIIETSLVTLREEAR